MNRESIFILSAGKRGHERYQGFSSTSCKQKKSHIPVIGAAGVGRGVATVQAATSSNTWPDCVGWTVQCLDPEVQCCLQGHQDCRTWCQSSNLGPHKQDMHSSVFSSSQLYSSNGVKNSHNLIQNGCFIILRAHAKPLHLHSLIHLITTLNERGVKKLHKTSELYLFFFTYLAQDLAWWGKKIIIKTK